MKYLWLLLLFSLPAFPAKVTKPTTITILPNSCPITSGTLTATLTSPRAAGVSPMLVFFDASGSTDSVLSGVKNTFQDITYTWNFGDAGISGTPNWANGSNPGNNSENTAYGGIAAHLYIVTPGQGDQTFTVTLGELDGTNTTACNVTVTAYDPIGSNGFPGTATTCVGATTLPAANAGGCPAGASTLLQPNFATAIASKGGSGKRVLFKCGDTFTGDNASATGTKWHIGAYGGCENTQAGRPIFRDSGTTGQITVANGAADGRITDIDFEGNGVVNSSGTVTTPFAGYAVQQIGGGPDSNQITLYNLYSNGNAANYLYSAGQQWGFISDVTTGMQSIGVFANYAGDNPPNNDSYFAALGNSFSGKGAPPSSGVGIENFRISYCNGCAISNNTLINANNVGADLKMHDKNTFNGNSTWVGRFSQNIVVSDNAMSGITGSQEMEVAPQNSSDDERLKNVVVERNVFNACLSNNFANMLYVSAVNVTVRDNAFYQCSGIAQGALAGINVQQRGIEPAPQAIEVFNNTCNLLSNQSSGQKCVVLASTASNSFAQNTLMYSPNGNAAVGNAGTGNTVSNNTTAPTANPGFVNASGTLMQIRDYKPTANYTGGTSVPVFFDGLGTPWPPTWSYGAIHP